MKNESVNEYSPSTVSHPGSTLLDLIEERSISQAELAQRMGRPKKTINEIIKGKTAITADTALELERVLSVPASFWNAREQQYREYRSRLAETTRLNGYIEWLKNSGIPVTELIKRSWIRAVSEPIDRVREVLTFFGVASPEQWDELYVQPQVKYRRAAHVSDKKGLIASWLRRGELDAQDVQTAPYDKEKFAAALVAARPLLQMNSLNEIFKPLQALCANAGVALVLVKEFDGAGVSAIARWIAPEKALIQMSFRGSRLDVWWFNFFHEAGHISLHGKKGIFIDTGPGVRDQADVEEAEADRFSTDKILPSRDFEKFLAEADLSDQKIRSLAEKFGLHPGAVAGRLLHHKAISPALANKFFKSLH